MEIDKKIMDEKRIFDWLNLNFISSEVDRKKLIEEDHSLNWELFNKRANPELNYYLSDILLDELYAYQDKYDFGLYLLFSVTKERLESLIHILGHPQAVCGELDFMEGNFDFLFWEKGKVTYWLHRDHFRNSKTGSHNKVILTITNMNIEDLRYKGSCD